MSQQNMWASTVAPMRHEALFEDRISLCFVDRPENFDEVIKQSAQRFSERDAFVCGAQRVSYAEFDAGLSRVAAHLHSAGVSIGDRVGIFAQNSIEFMYAVFGALRCGAIAVPLGIRLQEPELAYVIGDCGITALIFDSDLRERIPKALASGAALRRWTIGGQCTGAQPFEDLLRSPCPDFTAPTLAGGDTAMVMYTSGTTGRPKGAMLPHTAFVHSAMHFETCLGHTHNTKALLAIPASHISGLGAIVITMLRVGGCTVITDAFTPDSFMQTMSREQCTFSVLVPAMYKLCLMHPSFGDYDLSAWTVGIYGGAIMPPATIDELSKRLPRLTLVNGYGATETTSPAAVMPPGHTAAHMDSVGQTVPCGDIRIMDDEGREVPVGQPGELWIGGPMIARGYWNNPAATQANFTAGYWHSGDIGSIDPAGYVRILDRKKDMINRGGYKIFSAEVENELAAHPDILEAVVVPSPDPVLGERVHVFVCAREAALQPEAIQQFCAPLMADYKIPEIFSIGIEPLPRNLNGKFEKAVLRERARGMAERGEVQVVRAVRRT